MSERSSPTSLFDTIAARINASPEALRSLGFTGAVTGEGASTVALGTAAALGDVQSGPVLIIDANWIDHTVTDGAGARDAAGLAACLRGSIQAKAAVIPTAHRNVSLLPAGVENDRPPLGELPSVFASLERDFRYVVVDLPPVLTATALVISWSVVLARLFLVVRADSGRASLVRNALSALAPVTTPALILNAADARARRPAARAYVAR